jgi:hypothetical protein
LLDLDANVFIYHMPIAAKRQIRTKSTRRTEHIIDIKSDKFDQVTVDLQMSKSADRPQTELQGTASLQNKLTEVSAQKETKIHHNI